MSTTTTATTAIASDAAASSTGVGDGVQKNFKPQVPPSPSPPPRPPPPPPQLPVETCQHVHLGSAAGVPDALRRIRGGLRGLVHDVSSGAMPPFRSGVIRLTAAVPRTVDSLEWLSDLPRRGRAGASLNSVDPYGLKGRLVSKS